MISKEIKYPVVIAEIRRADDERTVITVLSKAPDILGQLTHLGWLPTDFYDAQLYTDLGNAVFGDTEVIKESLGTLFYCTLLSNSESERTGRGSEGYSLQFAGRYLALRAKVCRDASDVFSFYRELKWPDSAGWDLVPYNWSNLMGL